MNILGMGPLELLVVVVVALLVLGPERMGASMRTIGRFARQVRGHSDTIQRTIQEMMEEPAGPAQRAGPRPAQGGAPEGGAAGAQEGPQKGETGGAPGNEEGRSGG